MFSKKTEGLIAAPFTPMNGDGSLNTGLIPDYAVKLKKDRLKGVFICGTTGEGMLMTPEERMEVTEKWVNEKSEEFKVIVHVGTTSTKVSKQLAQHAERCGADAVGCMGPVFLQPTSANELVNFCAEIAAGASELPFYYYHIPSVSGVNISMVEFLNQGKERIPNLTGIKFTDNNFMDMIQCIMTDNGKWDVLHGFDELLLTGLVYGAKGAVGSTYNYIAPLYHAIINDFNHGNIEEARLKQLESISIIKVLNKYGGAIVAGKALMKEVGLDCGPCRLPLKNLTEEAYKNFIKEIEHTEFNKIVKITS